MSEFDTEDLSIEHWRNNNKLWVDIAYYEGQAASTILTEKDAIKLRDWLISCYPLPSLD